MGTGYTLLLRCPALSAARHRLANRRPRRQHNKETLTIFVKVFLLCHTCCASVFDPFALLTLRAGGTLTVPPTHIPFPPIGQVGDERAARSGKIRHIHRRTRRLPRRGVGLFRCQPLCKAGRRQHKAKDLDNMSRSFALCVKSEERAAGCRPYGG